MDDSTYPGAENTVTVTAEVHLFWNRETKVWEVYQIDMHEDIQIGDIFTTDDMQGLAV